MKKVLALVLAVMMMATVAFAADSTGSMDDGTVVNPGSGSTTDGAGSVLPGKTIKITKTGIMSVPGSPYVDSNVDTAAGEKLIKDINSSNYSIIFPLSTMMARAWLLVLASTMIRIRSRSSWPRIMI